MNKRNIYMDALSILSCIAVVYLHCSTVVFVNQGDLLWFLSIIVQSLFCFAVPVFFMISGANLIGYRAKYSTSTFLIKRVKRVVLPLVGFSFLYFAFACFASDVFGLAPRPFDLVSFGRDLLTNRICDVYWFIYSILALYLVTPLLSLAADDKKLLQYLLLLSFASTTVIPLINRFAPTHTLLNLLAIPYVTGPIFFYLLGYYIEHYVDAAAISRWLLAASSIIAVVCMVIMTVKINLSHTVLSGAFSNFDNFYINITNLPCVVLSASLFLLFKSYEPLMQDARCFTSKAFRTLCKAPFYVYLIHMLIINTLDVYVPHRILWDLGLRPVVVACIAFAFALAYVGAKTALVSLFRRFSTQ